MRDAAPYACDVCGKRREDDANRWWLVWLERQPWGSACVVVAPWFEAAAAAGNVRHTCGQAHCQTLVERWLTTGKLEE